jgi:hypothetical protein
MSDGPHRSLPMRPGWKKVAQYADNEAFAPNEVRDALMAAIEMDWRKDISPGFVSCIQDILGGETLFSDDSIQALEDLRQSVAGCPMENALLDHVVYAVSNVRSRDTALHEALACTLTDWSARRARQIEEHFLRESSAANTHNVRQRIEEAIQQAPITALASRLLDRESKPALRVVKHDGLDDGVPL